MCLAGGRCGLTRGLHERRIRLAHVAAAALWHARLVVAEVVEDLAPTACPAARDEPLDRAIGPPAAVSRGLDRLVCPPRASLSREPYQQPFRAARPELHGAGSLGDRQEHAFALVQ